jgi:hypothetical protein
MLQDLFGITRTGIESPAASEEVESIEEKVYQLVVQGMVRP